LVRIVLLLLLVGLPLPLRRHVVTNRASARGTQHAVMRHVSGDAADDGTLDTTLGLDWPRRGGRQGERDNGSGDQCFHGESLSMR
jgi:hypothetical protein